ncbi:MAG: exodeoxyribonuclease III [Polyangiaceae bacterium]|nr:exodeoxyribonuclease III [Polyangiaceae bacterium]
MKVATWNVNGIRRRHAEVIDWMTESAPDVVCLQELKASAEQVPEALTALRQYWSTWHGAPNGYSGVSLHLKKSFCTTEPRFTQPEFDFECRVVEARTGSLRWISVYVPNGGKDYTAKLSFLRVMRDYVRALHAAGDQVVLCGDMNVARTEMDVHPSQRDPERVGQRPDERALFEQLIGSGLVDVGRACDPTNERNFTWWPYWRQARARNLGWRLDYVLATENLAAHARSAVVGRTLGTSDHAPVTVDLDVLP